MACAFDAVHAINDDEWLRELSDACVRRVVPHGRHVHLVLENEHNTSNLLESHFNAQWSDDSHNTLHVLLTGEDESYYSAYSDQPIQKLARVLSEGLCTRASPRPSTTASRAANQADLPPTAFVMFLQNHDQVGNRAMGDRLRSLCSEDALYAATGLMLLTPQIPMLFMDEEYGSTQPFLFFTDYHDELADAVREGRRREFAKFSAFTDEKRRAQIPDPNAVETFRMSSPDESKRTRRSHRLAALLSLGAGRAHEAADAAPEECEGAWCQGDRRESRCWRTGGSAMAAPIRSRSIWARKPFAHRPSAGQGRLRNAGSCPRRGGSRRVGRRDFYRVADWRFRRSRVQS
jgi:malto-oligosyltrehalose trehalohydrolase